jgi:soluble lytic murein transglycosylase
MPKRRILNTILAGVSLLALGAGLHAGWSYVKSTPGGIAGLTETIAGKLRPQRPVTADASRTAPAAPDQPASPPAVRAGASPKPAAPSPEAAERQITTAAIAPPVVPQAASAEPQPPASALAAIGASIRQSGLESPSPALTPTVPKPPETPQVAAYAPASPLVQSEAEKLQGKAPSLPVDISGMKEALAAYKAGDVEKGDGFAKTATNDTARLALEWAALRLQPRAAGFARLEGFLAKQENWPAADWLRARAEQALYMESSGSARLARWFDANKAASSTGHMLVARRLLAEGKKQEAQAIVSRLWRDDDLTTWAEGALHKEFSELLTAADHRWRSDRLFYKEKYAASVAVAAKAGQEFLAFANARIAVAKGADPAKAGAKIDAKLRNDPTWHFARITRARKAQKFEEAANLLLAAPSNPAILISHDEWWEERRIVARKRLDDGDREAAYKIVAAHGAIGGEPLIAGEFHAGWIALRFLDRPEEALGHFARAGEAATTPMSRSRAYYWHARAAERGPEPDDAERLYALAARFSSNYYGQLAMERIGRKEIVIRTAPEVAEGDRRLPAIRVVEILESLGEKDLAMPLAVGMGRTLDDPSQLAALAAVLAKSQHARATLVVGKLAAQRGIELDDIAFPVYGIPEFSPLENSAARPLVYAIARQESAFQSNVVSHAGAKGLMQMLTSTAARTARNKKVAFDANRLLSDPAFNAQLGAAHLGELMEEHPGSLLMVFAAYNAGGHRVKQWIAAYGDPRKPGVDPIDWVERIPFTETRNYVQRVAENLAIYRTLLKAHSLPRVAETELRAYAARM